MNQKCCLSFRITQPPPTPSVWICTLPLPQSYRNTRTARTSTCGTRTSPLLPPRHTLPTHFSAHHDSRCHPLPASQAPHATPCTRISLLILNPIPLPIFLPFQLLSCSLISFPHVVKVHASTKVAPNSAVYTSGVKASDCNEKCHRLFADDVLADAPSQAPSSPRQTMASRVFFGGTDGDDSSRTKLWHVPFFFGWLTLLRLKRMEPKCASVDGFVLREASKQKKEERKTI